MTMTSETGEKRREAAAEKRKAAKRKTDGLTCSEAEVEAILAEGEST
jgi:hypothetical protein